ncbi:MAG: diacylglycerol kinase family protein [Calditrichia bacterium]
MNRICFIINPISGVNRNPQKIRQWIEAEFGPPGEEYRILKTGGPGDATLLAQEAVRSGFTIVAAVGGDGTINEVGRSLVGTSAALGVVPAGSGNGFARNFHIPLNQQLAIRLLKNPRLINIDVGRLNQHFFFNVAGLGIDAEISHNFEQFGMRGPLPYFLVGTRALLNFQPEAIELEWESNRQTILPLVLSIANAPQYGNGAIIAPQARPDDGKLDICFLDPLPIYRTIPNIYRLFNGTIDQIEEFHCFQVEHLVIRRIAEGIIHTDGNPHLERQELVLDVLPGALRLAVPHQV